MNKIYKIYSIKQSPIVLILGFLFFIQQKAEAQVNVTLTYTKSADNNCGTCTDCASVVGCGADQYWETEMNPSGGTYTGNGDNDNGGISNTSFTSTDIGFWCPGGTVQGRVRTCEDDDFGGCGGLLDDCVTGWVNGSTVTINTTNTSVGATAWSISGGSCTASGTWSLSSSGSWPGNNIVNTTGTTNTTCGTARNLGTNTSGNPVSGFNDESVDCTSSVWYTYYLTQDLASIDFDASASGLLNGCSEDEVRFNTTNNCTSGYCNVSDDYGIGTWGINNPRQGYYFIRVSMPTTVSGRQYDFKFVVNKGSVVTRPANDNYCGATSLSAAFNYNSTQLSATVNTDYATSEDFCSTNEPDNSNEQSAWYKFTTTATPPAIITLNPTASGACTGQAFVYSGVASGPCTGSAFTSYNTATNFNGLSLIDYTNFGNNFVINCPAASTTYYAQVQVGGLCNSGSVTLTVKSNGAPKPTNDLCANAISLGTLTAGATLGDAAGTNRWNNFCTGSAGDPNPGWTLDNNVRQLVWFKFNTGSVGRLVDIEAYNDPANLGDQIDLKLAIYKGPSCTGTYIDRDYDPTLTLCLDGLCSESFTDIKCLDANTDYYILVDGSGLNTQGFFGLTVRDRGPYPANDLICGATTIPVQTIYTYNNASLATETNIKGTNCFEPNPDWTFETGQDNDHAVWYYLGQVPGRTVVVDGNSSGGDNIDLQYALYSSTTAKGACVTPASSPTLTEVQKEYAGAGLIYDEDAYFNCLNPSLYYWLMVDGSAGPTSLITALEEGNFSLKVWFPEEGEISLCSAENLGTLTDGGTIYTRNLSNICGATTITNAPPPSAFTFDKAVVYQFTTPPATGFTDASVKIEGFSNPYYIGATHDVLGSAGGNMGLLAGDEIDLQLALYSPGACGASHFVVGSNYDITDGIHNVTGNNEQLIVNCLLPNTVYYLVVDGGANTNGYYDLRISDYAKHTTNNFLCSAIDITATNSAPWTNCNANQTVTLTGQNNYCSNTNNDFPSSFAGNGGRPPTWNEVNGPVWYKFKAPKSGKLEIRAINTISDLIAPFDEPEVSLQMAVFFLPGQAILNCPAGTNPFKENLQLITSDYDGL